MHSLGPWRNTKDNNKDFLQPEVTKNWTNEDELLLNH